MRTKTLISLAVIAALPITAQATDPVGPARDDSNSPVIATASGPYQIATKTSADESHIATTAYVKGAYNDAIAAVNKVNFQLNNNKQERLWIETDEDELFMNNVIKESLDDVDSSEYLVNGLAVKNAIDAQRVEIYTTWDDDDVAEVSLVTASAQQ